MLKRINIFIYATAALLVLLYRGLEIDSYLLMITSLLACWAITHIAIGKYRDPASSDIGLLMIFIMSFFWIAYVSKLPAIIYFPEVFWVVPKLISEDQLRHDAAFGFLVATVGYVSLLIVVMSVRFNFKVTKLPSTRLNLGGLLAFSTLLIILKLILKERFSLGIPGVQPIYMGVPMLAGVLTLLIGTGSLLAVNLYAYSAIYAAKRGPIFLALALVAINAGIDLRYGSKNTVMYQSVIFVYYYYVLNRFSPTEKRQNIRSISRIIGIFVVIILVFILLFYKFFNFFRFAILAGDISGVGIAAAIEQAFANETAGERSSLLEIYNRLNGLEVISAVIGVKENLSTNLTFSSWYDGSLTESFSFVIMGIENSGTAFGVTQFGYLYIAGGFIGLIVSIMIIGRIFMWLQSFLLKSPVDINLKIAALPVWCLMVLKLLLGSGNLILWGKEVLILILIFKYGPRLPIVGWESAK